MSHRHHRRNRPIRLPFLDSWDRQDDSDSSFQLESELSEAESTGSPIFAGNDVGKGIKKKESCIMHQDVDEDLTPDFYRLLEEKAESDDENEDYAESSLRSINNMEEKFCRYRQYVTESPVTDPFTAMQDLTPQMIKSFFTWLLKHRKSKDGRRRPGIKSEDTLKTYYKWLRLAYERATGSKMGNGDKGFNRMVDRMLRKLSKGHGLTRQKREKAVMFVEDQALVAQNNVTTTRIKYKHGRERIYALLYLDLGSNGPRPNSILALCYRHITVSLLRDPNGGPHNILIEFTYEFTKEFLGPKEANTFPVPEVIFDPSLVLSPQVALLGIFLADRAFLSSDLTSAEAFSKLDIRPGCNQLPLDLRPELADKPIFRKTNSTPYGCEISEDEPLQYSTVLRWMKDLGVLSGFKQITRPYSLRYGAGNAFNRSKDVSDALQLMMMQHRKMDTYIKYYLPRRVTADTRAIISGTKPQEDLMRAACRMQRWIDPERPQALTYEQSRSISQHPNVLKLIRQRQALKERFSYRATGHPDYKDINKAINNEKRRQRDALLKKVRKDFDVERPLHDIKQLLSGTKFNQDVKESLNDNDDMPVTQRRLVETLLTLPGTTLEEESRRRNAAINAVAAHCQIQEGGAVARNRWPRKGSCSLPKEVDPEAAAVELEQQRLNAAILSVFKDKRPEFCFICLGEKLINRFSRPGDLSKHFKRKHLRQMRESDLLECKVCLMDFHGVTHLRNHAERIHGTVSHGWN